jgi:hypothetical protein
MRTTPLVNAGGTDRDSSGLYDDTLTIGIEMLPATIGGSRREPTRSMTGSIPGLCDATYEDR